MSISESASPRSFPLFIYLLFTVHVLAVLDRCEPLAIVCIADFFFLWSFKWPTFLFFVRTNINSIPRSCLCYLF